MDDIQDIQALILKDGRVLVAKIIEREPEVIGQPDCIMVDPVIYDTTVEDYSKALSRFPGPNVTSATKIAILSDNILIMVDPASKLLAEYLVTIGD